MVPPSLDAGRKPLSILIREVTSVNPRRPSLAGSRTRRRSVTSWWHDRDSVTRRLRVLTGPCAATSYSDLETAFLICRPRPQEGGTVTARRPPCACRSSRTRSATTSPPRCGWPGRWTSPPSRSGSSTGTTSCTTRRPPGAGSPGNFRRAASPGRYGAVRRGGGSGTVDPPRAREGRRPRRRLGPGRLRDGGLGRPTRRATRRRVRRIPLDGDALRHAPGRTGDGHPRQRGIVAGVGPYRRRRAPVNTAPAPVTGRAPRLAVIGAGANIWPFHLRAIRATGFDLVAVHDVAAERAWAVAADAGCAAADSLAELFTVDSDAVAILAPHRQHHQLVRVALAAGRHVLVEKPIAVTVDEARDLGTAAQASGRLPPECLQHRTPPQPAEARPLPRTRGPR